MSHPDSFINPLYKTLSPDLQELFDQRMRSGKIGILLIMDREELVRDLTEDEKKSVSGQQNISPSHIITSSKYQIQYEKLVQEFDRQIQTLLTKGYHALADMNEQEFLSHIEPLRGKLQEFAIQEFEEGRIPFVIVVSNKLVSLEYQIPLMEVDGKKGFTTLDLSEFKTVKGVKIPESMAYLVVDVENGKVMLGKSADEAVTQLKKEGRSPMTAEEGVALILQHPEILKDHYMDLPGSRRGGVEVALLWLNEGRPKLDWSWASHSNAKWGSASCCKRVGF